MLAARRVSEAKEWEGEVVVDVLEHDLDRCAFSETFARCGGSVAVSLDERADEERSLLEPHHDRAHTGHTRRTLAGSGGGRS